MYWLKTIVFKYFMYCNWCYDIFAALDDSIEILDEVQGVRPLDGGGAIELEVLYDGSGQQVIHVSGFVKYGSVQYAIAVSLYY